MDEHDLQHFHESVEGVVLQSQILQFDAAVCVLYAAVDQQLMHHPWVASEQLELQRQSTTWEHQPGRFQIQCPSDHAT